MRWIVWIAGLSACDRSVAVVPDNHAPAAVILAPQDDDDVGSPIAFEARAEADESFTFRLTSDVDGELDAPDSVEGAIEGDVVLTAGSHHLTLVVTDESGNRGEDSVDIEVLAQK